MQNIDTTEMSNIELADTIHNLQNELNLRICNLGSGSWLRDQLEGAALHQRSWSTNHQNNMKFGGELRDN
jgi:glucuronate isomerase